MTDAQATALKWLIEHNGDGCFDKNGVLLAAGVKAPFMRSTWNILAALGKVEFYGGVKQGGKGYGRLRIKT